MSVSGMEYQIDPEDDKKVQVQTVDNELVLIISQGDCEIFMEAEMYDELKKTSGRIVFGFGENLLDDSLTNNSVTWHG